MQQQTTEKKLRVLPTLKSHISFSEMREWNECPHRHYISQVKKLMPPQNSEELVVGKLIHAAIENKLTGDTKSISTLVQECIELNKEYELDYITLTESCEKASTSAYNCIAEKIKNFRVHSVEEQLYEIIDDEKYNDVAFNGYIDAVFYDVDNDVYWIVDWKTTRSSWNSYKRLDEKTHAQLVYYRNYWSQKHNVPEHKVRCAFVLLSKSGWTTEFFEIQMSVPKTERCLSMLRSTVNGISRGLVFKNKHSCTYCPIRWTELCP